MTAVDIATIAQPVVAAVVGAGQIAVVWYGIRAMIAANDERAAGAAEAGRHAGKLAAESQRSADQRHKAAQRRADQRHAEAMQRHADAMRLDDQRHAEAMTALTALIERTAPHPETSR